MTIQIIELNRPSRNGRIYTWENFEPFSKSERPLLGEFYAHNASPDVSLDNIAFTVSNLRPENEFLVGDIKVLTTPVAINSKLQEMIDNDMVLFGPKGQAKLNEDGTMAEYNLISITVDLKQ